MTAVAEDPMPREIQLPPPAPSAKRGRIRTIDWLRGLSVVVMVAVHSLIFLTPAHDADRARDYFANIGGLPAPTFTFAAGFSLALVTARADMNAAQRWARARKSALRIGQVLLGSVLLRHVMWDNFRHPHMWLWIDVLTSIALMLVVCWVVLFLLPARRWVRYVAFTLLALAAFVIGPWVDKPHTFGWATNVFNNSPYPDTWPLVPWAGYGWCGAIVGLAVGGATTARAQRWALAFALFGLLVFGLLSRFGGDWLCRLIDPTVNPTLFTNSGDRLWRIALIGLFFCGLEARGFTFVRGPVKPLGVIVTLFSHHSMVAYIGHLILIYGYWKFRPLNRFILNVDWPAYVGLMLVVMMGTVGLCTAFEALRRWRERVRPVEAGRGFEVVTGR